MAYAELAGPRAVAGPLRAAAADRRLRAAGLLAPADRRPRGLDLGARRRGGARVSPRPASAEAAELAAMLALLVAACFLLARLARLGWVADYLSRPVLIGYIHGVAVVLVIGQLGKLLGLDIDAARPAPAAGRGRRASSATSAARRSRSARVALAILLPLRFLAPRVPAPLLVVVGAIVASARSTSPPTASRSSARIPSGPARARRCRRRRWRTRSTLLPAAVGLFLVCFADAVLTARSFAGPPRPARPRRPGARSPWAPPTPRPG